MIEVTCAIIKEGERVLITQRGEQMAHPLMWEFPGGKVYTGESPERCLKREIREELNIEIEVERLLPSVIYNYGYQQIKLIPFICSIREGEILLTEHNDWRWIRRSELKDFRLLEADMLVVERMNGAWS
jgi:8-oxo-dGTP diphosphatase